MRKTLNISILALFLSVPVFAQVKTNLEQVYSLLDKSVQSVFDGKGTKEKKVFINFSSPAGYSFLKNAVIEKSGKYSGIKESKENSDYIFNYAVEEASVKYSDTFTKSFLGRNFVEREVLLKGFSGLNKPDEAVLAGRFEFTEKDTVEYRGLKNLGNGEYPFTNPEIPSEPFFSSILEPVIAIGSAVTIIYLLFTVRSK